MPRLDKTGPMGQGPLTGRGMGPCGGGSTYGFRGLGRRLGRGFGWRNLKGYYPAQTATKKEEAEMLSEEAELLEEELKNVKSRLAQLKNKK